MNFWGNYKLLDKKEIDFSVLELRRQDNMEIGNRLNHSFKYWSE